MAAMSAMLITVAMLMPMHSWQVPSRWPTQRALPSQLAAIRGGVRIRGALWIYCPIGHKPARDPMRPVDCLACSCRTQSGCARGR